MMARLNLCPVTFKNWIHFGIEIVDSRIALHRRCVDKSTYLVLFLLLNSKCPFHWDVGSLFDVRVMGEHDPLPLESTTRVEVVGVDGDDSESYRTKKRPEMKHRSLRARTIQCKLVVTWLDVISIVSDHFVRTAHNNWKGEHSTLPWPQRASITCYDSQSFRAYLWGILASSHFRNAPKHR